MQWYSKTIREAIAKRRNLMHTDTVAMASDDRISHCELIERVSPYCWRFIEVWNDGTRIHRYSDDVIRPTDGDYTHSVGRFK